MKKTTVLKLLIVLLLKSTLFSQVITSGIQRVSNGGTYTLVLPYDITFSSVSVVGSSTVLKILESHILTNSDNTKGTILNGGTIQGTATLKTSFIDVSNNGMINIAGLQITGMQSDALTFGSGANTLTLAGGGSGNIDLGGGNDILVISSTYTGNIDGGAGTDTLRITTGGIVSGTASNFEKLDIIQLANNTAGIGSNGITLLGGGTLAVGTAKNRNASNITLTRGTNTTGSIVSINLGTNAPASSTPIFSTLPSLTGTGKVNLNIGGSLALNASQVLASGDVTSSYRIISAGFNLEFNGTNTNIVHSGGVFIGGVQQVTSGSTHRITLTANTTVTSISVVGSSTVLTINGRRNYINSDNTKGTILNGGTIQGTATLKTSFIDVSNNGIIDIKNLIITGTQSKALTLGNSKTTLTLRGGGSGNIDLGGGNDRLVINSSYAGDLDGGAGTDTLYLYGGTISGDVTNFEELETIHTNGNIINSNFVISGNTTLNRFLSGTGHLTSGTISGTGAGNINIARLTITGSQTQALIFGSSANTVWMLSRGSGNIDLGGGNDILVISSTYTGNIDGGAGTDTLRITTGGIVSGTASNFEKLDIIQLANNTAGIGSNGITLLGGGTLAVGTAKNRNASNITLTRGTNTTGSIVSINLGTNAPASSTPIFSTLPSLTGTGKVNLNIGGSLALNASQVLASGDVTSDYSINTGFNLEFNGTNTIITREAPPEPEAPAPTTEPEAPAPPAVIKNTVNLASSVLSVASSAVTMTATLTNSFITTRTVNLATGKTKGVKGVENESKLLSYNIWLDFGFGFGGLDGDNDAKGYDFSSSSIRLGMDARLENIILGSALSYTTTSLDNEGTTGESDLNTLGLSFYGSYTELKRYRIDYFVSFAINDIELIGDNTGSLSSSLMDLSTTAHYTGYKDYTPFVSLRLVLNDFSSYNLEGTLPMKIAGESYNSFFINFGTRWGRDWKTQNYNHNLGLKTSLHYNLMDTKRETEATFKSGTQPFKLQGVEEDSFNIGLGIDYSLKKNNMTYLFSYDMVFSSSSNSHRLTLKANYKF